jgi:L-fucose mutarotase/ribose pyranase (RbsD/FucU family)
VFIYRYRTWLSGSKIATLKMLRICDPAVEVAYRQVIDRHWPNTPPIQRIDRFDFYERTKESYAVLMTGETVKYGNIILKKGVTPTFTK